MPKKRYSSEQIIVKLREAEVLESKGKGQVNNGPEKNCDVSIATSTVYGFVQGVGVAIKGGGTEKTFTARASHKDMSWIYEINARGEIRDITNQ